VTDRRPPDDGRPVGGWVGTGPLGPTGGVGMGQDAAETLAAAFGLLGDPTRLRILHALSCSPEVHVNGLVELLGLSQSTISQQLRILRDRAIVKRRREGRLTYYRLADGSLRRVLCGSRDVAGDLATFLAEYTGTRREPADG
jgi:ArsR family transcriptional regulator, lead/cadmium/zinc/bismuth-responsive transcriptional repressor